MTPDIEIPIKLNMTARKALLIDILIFGIILCAFFAGFWLGQKQQGEEKIAFFKEYIEKQCICREQLIFTKNKAEYPIVQLPYTLP